MLRYAAALQSRCVFCDNRNLNLLEQNFRFKTSKICGHQM